MRSALRDAASEEKPLSVMLGALSVSTLCDRPVLGLPNRLKFGLLHVPTAASAPGRMGCSTVLAAAAAAAPATVPIVPGAGAGSTPTFCPSELTAPTMRFSAS